MIIKTKITRPKNCSKEILPGMRLVVKEDGSLEARIRVGKNQVVVGHAKDKETAWVDNRPLYNQEELWKKE